MSGLAWALVAVPLGCGALLAVAGRRADRMAGPAAVAVAAAALGLAIAAAVARPAAAAPLLAGIDAGVAVDGLSAVMVVTVGAATLLVLLFAAGHPGLAAGRARFVGLMLMFAGAMLLTVTATTLVLLLMAWEAMGAASYALIGFWWDEDERVDAANTAFLTTRAADLGLYLAAGAAVAGGVTGMRIADLGGAAEPWRSVIVAGVVAAALGKSAQLPFSFWLSRAMEGPSPVSALLHSAAMVAAGGYLLIRLVDPLQASGWGDEAAAWAGAATALVVGLVALAQRDLKQLLAASTCAQIGFVVMAAGVGARTGGTMQLVAHAAVKSLLFLCAGALMTLYGTKVMRRLAGSIGRRPAVGVPTAVGAAALAGVPPLSLWATKDEVLAGVRADSVALWSVGLAAAAVSAAYSARLLALLTGPPGAAPEPGPERERSSRGPTRPMVATLGILAVPAAALSVLALPAVREHLAQAIGGAGEATPTAAELVLSGLIAVASAGVAWWAVRRGWSAPAAVAAPLHGWLGLERAARAGVAAPTMALARSLAAFDDGLLARAPAAAAATGTRAARALRGVDGLVSGAVDGLAAAARGLGGLARRPQTGRLHQYYAQAAVGLIALTLLVVLIR